MKYKIEIDIELPKERIISLLEDRKNDSKWQEGLKSFHHIDGTAGEIGSKSKITYVFGKKEIDITETIIKKSSDETTFEYESNMVYNIVKNKFVSIDESTTKWKQYQDFRGKSILLRTMIFIMPNMFKKQSVQFLNNFKKFAESN